MPKTHLGLHEAHSCPRELIYSCICTLYIVCVHVHVADSYTSTVASTCTIVHVYSVIETRQSRATTPKSNSSREKEELPKAGLEPVTFCVLGRRSTN